MRIDKKTLLDNSFNDKKKRAALFRAALFVFLQFNVEISFGLGVGNDESSGVQFISQQTQDLFESSIPNVISNPRSADRINSKCLELEPENIHCQYLQFFLNKRLGRLQSSPIEEVKFLLWRKKIFDQDRDQTALLLISSFESKIVSKNYSLARQILDRLSIEFSDYPDLLIMKRNLNFLSSEQPLNDTDQLFNLNKAFEIYQKRCRNLDSMTIRKYLFDLDLCNRREINDL